MQRWKLLQSCREGCQGGQGSHPPLRHRPHYCKLFLIQYEQNLLTLLLLFSKGLQIWEPIPASWSAASCGETRHGMQSVQHCAHAWSPMAQSGAMLSHWWLFQVVNQTWIQSGRCGKWHRPSQPPNERQRRGGCSGDEWSSPANSGAKAFHGRTIRYKIQLPTLL